MTTLNAKCSGAWRAADGTPVTIVSVTGRAATVELSAPHATYKAGGRVTLPQTWVDEEPEPERCPSFLWACQPTLRWPLRKALPLYGWAPCSSGSACMFKKGKP